VTPRLIFDVGAYRGDFARTALSVWPSARVACFEPLPQGRRQIRALIEESPKITLHETLVGATVQAGVPMHVAETSSSLLRDAENEGFPVEHFPQTTVDTVVRDSYAGQAPDLLKLDVQGYELQVLKGSEASLGQTRVVLSEINLLDLHEHAPLLHEMVAWLSERGFVAYDICGISRRPLDDALWQADMIFVRGNDELRRNKGYYDRRSWFRT
jgi:FkbM family methyltransferase